MAILGPGHTSLCKAPSPRQPCSPPYEYAPPKYCEAFPACQPAHPPWSVSESRSILPLSPQATPSSASPSNSQTDYSTTIGKHHPSCPQQTPCATPPSCPPCPGL